MDIRDRFKHLTEREQISRLEALSFINDPSISSTRAKSDMRLLLKRYDEAKERFPSSNVVMSNDRLGKGDVWID